MRTLKWDLMFNPEEETSIAIVWISFPSLPPIFFGKEAVFSLAAAVGKPLQVDMVTRNQTRPSCARVKVEVDLLKEFPKRIKIGVRKQNEEGHNAEQCYVEHPELYPEEKKDREEDKKKAWKNSRREVDDKNGDRPTEKKEEEFVEQKYKKWGGGRNKQPEKMWNKVGIITGNQFNMLEQEMKEKEEEEKQLKENMMALEDDKEKTPGVQGSYNREGRKKTQVRSKGTNEIEVSNSSKGDNTTLLEDRGSGHKEGTHKDNKENATNNNIKEQGMVETNCEKILHNRLDVIIDLDRDNRTEKEPIV
ncbi:hypothetical protein KY290_033858 [Solanum tuberosum]|uniref:DUF4283 domain-containing protein n=1 Tax=Solanum tuberosum TaxID=4113 RepID=A0ABQ7U1Q8_SOLTU|nr:hypothetical protein KY289_033229 [Solanum tuberosum]KAH0740815.1 hypothetical protein KY290_033858 [Solanum tuberosum]